MQFLISVYLFTIVIVRYFPKMFSINCAWLHCVAGRQLYQVHVSLAVQWLNWHSYFLFFIPHMDRGKMTPCSWLYKKAQSSQVIHNITWWCHMNALYSCWRLQQWRVVFHPKAWWFGSPYPLHIDTVDDILVWSKSLAHLQASCRLKREIQHQLQHSLPQ